MKMSRRTFFRTVPMIAVMVALPLSSRSVSASFTVEHGAASADLRAAPGGLARPAGDPPFESWWVQTHLPTKAWPTPVEVNEPVSSVQVGRLFRVDGLHDSYRLPVWDPRTNEHIYIGAEAVGPVEPPFWADFAGDGRWIDVNLSLPQHVRAMQGDQEVFRDLVTAGIQGRTASGFYRIIRRVENETMDSRTVPDATRQYLLKDVLYTQYFLNDGSAIHYNWWASSWGYPGSQGCLGMRLAGAKYMWDWANIGTPLAIHR